MESIPNYLSTDKIEDVLDRTIVNKEYERKAKMLDLFNKIIDKDFTAGNWKAGKFNELSMIQYYDDEYLEAHPFIRIENANPNLKAFLLVRGVKVPMNVIETSHNGTEKINYIIQYPKYLLNKFTEHYAAIEGILIPKEFYNSNTKFYTGFDDLFGDSVSRNTYQENSVSTLNTIV